MKRAHISKRLDRWVRVRAGNVCEYCQLPQEFQEATFHVDHILPLARRGKTIPLNLALACVSCSLRKGVRILSFNPRRQDWYKHFAWTTEWRVRGKTAAVML